MSRIAERVREAVEGAVTGLGYELTEVEYVKKGSAFHLTAYIYSKDGIGLDDCETVHNAIDPIIDALDPTDGKPYVLNVSSPGLDRPFKTARDYERNYGEEVEIKLYSPIDKKKTFEGVLLRFDGERVTISDGGTERTFGVKNTAFVRPLVGFE